MGEAMLWVVNNSYFCSFALKGRLEDPTQRFLLCSNIPYLGQPVSERARRL